MIMWLLVVAALVASAGAYELSDEDYHEMPKLYVLDDWEECVARRGMFCLGSFDLMPHKNERLFSVIQRFSENQYHFNHTHIYRGFCLPSTCGHIQGPSPRDRFSRCVSNLTRAQHGLEANLTELQYCREGSSKRPVDEWDLAFAGVVVMVLLMNLIGSAYDVFRNKNNKANEQLIAWSLVANWQRLIADHSGRDQRLAALKPVHGMKALTLLLVILAHSVLFYHVTYIYNPQFIDKNSQYVLFAYLQNGTSIVQTFIMVSSFLLAYNLLIHNADNQKKQLSLKMLPQYLMHRISRISPLYLFILGLATSWWAHVSDGPLWSPMIEEETKRCRSKFWAQALYINNFVKPDEQCLVHTWFLAVEMQLYIVCLVLMLVLGRWPRVAPKVLGAMVLGSMLLNFGIIYKWNLKPMVLLMVPEKMRTVFLGERSFKWLYTAPWDSLPSALIGLLVAFLYHSHQIDEYRPAQKMTMRVLYRLSVPCMFAWVVCGYWVKFFSNPLWVSLYATIDRPVFVSLTAFAMYGFFNKIDSVWWKFLSWRGWEILGRMSLSIYLVHWLFSMLLMALRTNANRTSVFDIGEHWLATIFLTYSAALPLHLLVEIPAMRFLQSLTSKSR